MDKKNLTALLKAVKAMILRERVAYKDYLGEETVTRLLISGTLPNGDGDLTLEDPTFTGFVVGETYRVTIDGQTTDCVAAFYGEDIIVSVGDINTNYAVVGIISGHAVGMSVGEYVGKSITISQTKTTKKYRTKKLPTELLPNGLAKSADVSKVATIAKNAQSMANSAQSTAETAKSTAETAQTTAETAQSTAETAQTTAETAQTTAETAQSTAETAKSTAETAQATAVNNNVAVNALSGEVTISWDGNTDGLFVSSGYCRVSEFSFQGVNLLRSGFSAENSAGTNLYQSLKNSLGEIQFRIGGPLGEIYNTIQIVQTPRNLNTNLSSPPFAPTGVYFPIGDNSFSKLIVKVSPKDPNVSITPTHDPDAILSTPQTLTEEQKQQARENIGVDNTLGITSATVGQIPKITAVDADGKPTAWEAVDMAGGDGGLLYHYATTEDAIITPTALTPSIDISTANLLLFRWHINGYGAEFGGKLMINNQPITTYFPYLHRKAGDTVDLFCLVAVSDVSLTLIKFIVDSNYSAGSADFVYAAGSGAVTNTINIPNNGAIESIGIQGAVVSGSNPTNTGTDQDYTTAGFSVDVYKVV